MNTPVRSNPDRVFFGFLIAPVAGAFAYACAYAIMGGIFAGQWSVSGAAYIFVFALIFAIGSTVFLGIPGYLLIRRRNRLTLVNVAFTSGILGWVPCLWFNSSGIWYLATKNPWDLPVSGFVFLMLQHWVLAFASGVAGGLAFWTYVVQRDPDHNNLVAS